MAQYFEDSGAQFGIRPLAGSGLRSQLYTQWWLNRQLREQAQRFLARSQETQEWSHTPIVTLPSPPQQSSSL